MSYNRGAQIQKLAYDLNMNYSPEDTWGVTTLLKDFSLFRRGARRRRKVSNVLQRKDGMLELDVRVFDYRYSIKTHNSSRTFKQTVFFVQSKKLGLPQFLLKPESFFHKVGQWLSLAGDIDFEKHPKFSGQYWLKGDDEDYIRASFKDEVLQFFSIEKGWTLEGINYYLIFYQNNKLLLPSQIASFYRKGMHLHDMLIAEGI